MARVVRSIDFSSPDPGVIEEAVGCLVAGGIVAAPTETRYGLLVRADRDGELKKLYDAKGRALNLPTALFVADTTEAARYGEVNETAKALADALLPGPLTLVLKSRCDWGPPRVVAGKIGFRISSAPVIRDILKRVGFALTATSANLSGKPESVVTDDIVQAFGDKVDLYLDAGRIDFPLSTVVDCSGGVAQIVRHGAVSDEVIENLTGRFSN